MALVFFGLKKFANLQINYAFFPKDKLAYVIALQRNMLSLYLLKISHIIRNELSIVMKKDSSNVIMEEAIRRILNSSKHSK